MAERRPLVLINGQLQELPVGDTVPGSGGGATYPAGGTTGQVLAKASNSDNDVEWKDDEVGSGGGGGGSSTREIIHTIDASTTNSHTIDLTGYDDISISLHNVAFTGSLGIALSSDGGSSTQPIFWTATGQSDTASTGTVFFGDSTSPLSVGARLQDVSLAAPSQFFVWRSDTASDNYHYSGQTTDLAVTNAVVIDATSMTGGTIYVTGVPTSGSGSGGGSGTPSVGFRYEMSSTQAVPSTTGTKVIFDTGVETDLPGYDTVTGVWTVPANYDGQRVVMNAGVWSDSFVGEAMDVAFIKDNTTAVANERDANTHSVNVSTVRKVTTGETYHVQLYTDSASTVGVRDTCYFSVTVLGAGEQGPAGNDGAAGQGVAAGGTAGQILSKIDGTDYNTEWIDAPSGGELPTVYGDQVDVPTPLGSNSTSSSPYNLKGNQFLVVNDMRITHVGFRVSIASSGEVVAAVLSNSESGQANAVIDRISKATVASTVVNQDTLIALDTPLDVQAGEHVFIGYARTDNAPNGASGATYHDLNGVANWVGYGDDNNFEWLNSYRTDDTMDYQVGSLLTSNANSNDPWAAWFSYQLPLPYVTEAPKDNKDYIRRNGAWVESASGGATALDVDFAETGWAYQSGVPDVVFNLPTSQAGDQLVLAIVTSTTDDEINDVTGWTKEYYFRESGINFVILSKIADGSEGNTLSVNTDGASNIHHTGHAIRIRGGDFSNGLFKFIDTAFDGVAKDYADLPLYNNPKDKALVFTICASRSGSTSAHVNFDIPDGLEAKGAKQNGGATNNTTAIVSRGFAGVVGPGSPINDTVPYKYNDGTNLSSNIAKINMTLTMMFDIEGSQYAHAPGDEVSSDTLTDIETTPSPDTEGRDLKGQYFRMEETRYLTELSFAMTSNVTKTYKILVLEGQRYRSSSQPVYAVTYESKDTFGPIASDGDLITQRFDPPLKLEKGRHYSFAVQDQEYAAARVRTVSGEDPLDQPVRNGFRMLARTRRAVGGAITGLNNSHLLHDAEHSIQDIRIKSISGYNLFNTDEDDLPKVGRWIRTTGNMQSGSGAMKPDTAVINTTGADFVDGEYTVPTEMAGIIEVTAGFQWDTNQYSYMIVEVDSGSGYEERGRFGVWDAAYTVRAISLPPTLVQVSEGDLLRVRTVTATTQNQTASDTSTFIQLKKV